MSKPTIVFCVMSGPVDSDGSKRRYYGVINSDIPNKIAPMNYRAEGYGHRSRRVELSRGGVLHASAADEFTDLRDFEVVA